MSNVNNQNQSNAQNKKNQDYFDTILFANKARINSVREVTPKQGKPYFALSITVIDTDEQGKKSYSNVETTARGDKVVALLNEFCDAFPTHQDKKYWLADVAIGSVKDAMYSSKKHNCNKPQLKGRLINIKSLNLDGKTVFGELSSEPQSLLSAQAYINEINMVNKTAKATLLDGAVNKPNYRSINLSFADIAEFDVLQEQGLCPRGYDFRNEDAKIYGIFEIRNITAELYQYEGNDQTSLSGRLTGIRYLKVNNEVMTAAKASKDTPPKAVETEVQSSAEQALENTTPQQPVDTQPQSAVAA